MIARHEALPRRGRLFLLNSIIFVRILDETLLTRHCSEQLIPHLFSLAHTPAAPNNDTLTVQLRKHVYKTAGFYFIAGRGMVPFPNEGLQRGNLSTLRSGGFQVLGSAAAPPQLCLFGHLTPLRWRGPQM